MKRSWIALVAVVAVAVSTMTLAPLDARAQAANTVQPHALGSLLVFPIFDVIGANRTKIRITNDGSTGVPATDLRVRVTYVCQPQGASSSCPSLSEDWPLAPNQTIVLDVGDRIFGACPSNQGYIVAYAAAPCTSSSPSFRRRSRTCLAATTGSIPEGDLAPISYNQLYGSYHLYYNGSANPGTLLCNGVPCSPPPAGPFPDVESAGAIAIQSKQGSLAFLGNVSNGRLRTSFGKTAASDYVAIPKVAKTDFAVPGAALIAGPSTFTPFIPPDTVSGTELQTNVILLNLDYTAFGPATPATTSVQATNWFAVSFTSSHSFLCWERIPVNLIDTRLTAAGPFGANYGNIEFTPSPPGSPDGPFLLGAIEEVSTVGRTIRTMTQQGTSPNQAIFLIAP